jgi:hypothetical protein
MGGKKSAPIHQNPDSSAEVPVLEARLGLRRDGDRITVVD